MSNYLPPEKRSALSTPKSTNTGDSLSFSASMIGPCSSEDDPYEPYVPRRGWALARYNLACSMLVVVPLLVWVGLLVLIGLFAKGEDVQILVGFVTIAPLVLLLSWNS